MNYKMYEFTNEQGNELKENIKKALHYAGLAMECVEEACDPEKMGMRMGRRDEGMGYREDGMGYRDEGMGYRDEGMGMRRGVRGTGRYGRRDEGGYRDPMF